MFIHRTILITLKTKYCLETEISAILFTSAGEHSMLPSKSSNLSLQINDFIGTKNFKLAELKEKDIL
jgi:hypothetical protein